MENEYKIPYMCGFFKAIYSFYHISRVPLVKLDYEVGIK